jgi:hypothetical protein
LLKISSAAFLLLLEKLCKMSAINFSCHLNFSLATFMLVGRTFCHLANYVNFVDLTFADRFFRLSLFIFFNPPVPYLFFGGIIFRYFLTDLYPIFILLIWRRLGHAGPVRFVSERQPGGGREREQQPAGPGHLPHTPGLRLRVSC